MDTQLIKNFKNKIEEFDKIVELLDKYCSKIMAYLTIIYPKEKGFNELLRELNKLIEENPTQIKGISKKTLSDHLKHLLEKELIVVREIKGSKLKIKPRKYKLSPYFRDLGKDIVVFEYRTPEDLIKEMTKEKITPLTIMFIDILFETYTELLKNTLNYSEKISAYSRGIIYERFEILLKAYRKTVYDKMEKENALKIIDEHDKWWIKTRNDKWGSLIKKKSYYYQTYKSEE